MLVLSRRVGEAFRIGDEIIVEVVALKRDNVVRLGISAPKELPVIRAETHQPIRRQNEKD